MARIPMIHGTEDWLNPEQKRICDEIISGPRGHVPAPMLPMLHRPAMADPWQKLGAACRYGSCLGPRLSELAILLTGRAYDCAVEFSLHARHGRAAGLEEHILESIKQGTRPALTLADDIAVYDYADEILTTHFVSDETYKRVLDRWGVDGVVELTAIVGYYTMTAMALNAHQVPVTAGEKLETLPPRPAR